MPATVYRNAYRHLLGVWAVAALPMALAASSIPRIISPVPAVLRVLLLGIVVALAIAWLVEPIWAARFRTLTVDDREVTLRAGWLATETRTAARSEITSVQVEQPISNRLTRLWSVAIFTQGVSEASMKMPALSHSDAMELVSLAHHGERADERPTEASEPVSEPGSAVPEPEQTTVLYRAPASDVAVTAISTGVPLVIAAGVVGLVGDAADLTGGAGWSSPATLVALVAFGGAAVVLLTALRFRHYSIERGPGGELTIRYGAIDSVEHTLIPQDRLTITARRSPVDLLFGKTSLRYNHARADGRRVVFPSMSQETFARTSRAVDGRERGIAPPHVRPTWTAAHAGLAVAGTTIAVVTARQHEYWAAGLTFAAALVGMWLLHFASRRMSQSPHPELLQMRAAGLSHSTTVVPHEAMSMVVSRRLPGLPARIVSMTGWSHGRLRYRFASRTDAMVESVVARSGMGSSPD